MPGRTAQGQDAAMEPLETLLVSLHYAYPTAIFLYFIISLSVSVCTLQTFSRARQHPRRRLVLSLMFFSVLSYLGQVAAIIAPSVIANKWFGQQDTMIGLLSCVLVFGLQLATLVDTEKPVWYPYIGSYLLALAFEPALEVVSVLARPPSFGNAFDILDLSIVAARYVAIILTVLTYFGWRCRALEQAAGAEAAASDAERQPLLQKDTNAGHTPGESESSQSSGYGSASDSSTDASNSPTDTPESPWERREREAREQMEKRLKEQGNWLTYVKSFLIFLPYIWPVNNRALQFRAVLVGVCLLLNNALNVLIPRQLGIVTDSLNHYNDKNPWIQVLIFAGLKFSASEAGLTLIRQWLWVPVEFYSFDAMSTAAYSHVLRLSSDFHDSKSSSDIMVAIQSGQNVSNLLESICFSAIPMLIDMAVAFVYLSAMFGPYEGLITLATSVIFVYIAGRMISGLKDARRSEISAWFEEHYVRQSGIQGWSTVTAFNQVDYEEQRYSKAVKDRVSSSQTVYFGYLVAYAFQYTVLLAGLLAGAFLAVWQVMAGQTTPGQFIMLLTYWAQLVAPLNFFAGLGKTVSKNLIHAEQLLEIMKTKPTVVNKEDAQELKFVGGAVEFDHVYFSYDKKKQILKDISFSVTPGTTVAFVGATGAGKSTILKLLDRFYDVTGGSVKIDGQDVRDVDLYSLRSQIGIVPQTPILFDDTVMNNVRYAKLHATDEEVFEACRAASIHDQILGLTDGYNTRVGERGMKLSGGELQRVAIARAILKNPSIVLLDEATSAVDTETEQKIQVALRALCENRTTFVVAHRLSTVMNADCIIVVSNGELVEQGSHEDLIRADGKYAELWSKQIFVKPKDKEAKDDEAQKKKQTKIANIVNDLTPEATSSELAKVKSTPSLKNAAGAGTDGTGHSGRSDGDGGDDGSGSDAGPSSQGGSQQPVAKTPSGQHKREGSKLNPDAPTFTPRSFAAAGGAATPGSPSVPASRIPTPRRLSLNSDLTQAPSIIRKSSRPTINIKPVEEAPKSPELSSALVAEPAVQNHREDKSEAGTEAGTAAGSEDVSGPASSEPAAPTGSQETAAKPGGGSRGKSRPDKAKWRRPRYSRRVQSKSEPSGSKANDN